MTDIIEGRNPVIEALKSGYPVKKVMLVSGTGRGQTISEILQLARERGIPVEYAERDAINTLSVTGASQGVIACVAGREYVDLDDLLAISRQRNEPPLYVVLDGIEDPHNLGAILRTAEATGVHGVVVRSRRAAGLTPAVFKASAGAAQYVAAARVPNISQAIDALKKNNVWSVGLDRAGESDYTAMDYRPPTAIVVGSEGKGISELVRKKCDFLASIPMCGKVTSLNASVAAAVVMYEALKQRSCHTSS